MLSNREESLKINFPVVLMCRVAVLVFGLLVALLGGAQATDGHPIYGVKLCGREFIRAVIFTCGGSRWRRSLDDSGETDNVLL